MSRTHLTLLDSEYSKGNDVYITFDCDVIKPKFSDSKPSMNNDVILEWVRMIVFLFQN